MYRAIPKNSGLCQRRMTSDAQLLGILFVLGNMTFSINLWFAKRSPVVSESFPKFNVNEHCDFSLVGFKPALSTVAW
jgi:hypothetical protein